jgi:hypothetical protein
MNDEDTDKKVSGRSNPYIQAKHDSDLRNGSSDSADEGKDTTSNRETNQSEQSASGDSSELSKDSLDPEPLNLPEGVTDAANVVMVMIDPMTGTIKTENLVTIMRDMFRTIGSTLDRLDALEADESPIIKV